MRTEYNNYASQALEKAAQDAASCHQKYIGTEHLILGLLAQPDSLSGRVLYENGLNYSRSRQRWSRSPICPRYSGGSDRGPPRPPDTAGGQS